MEATYQDEPEGAMKRLKKWKTFLMIALLLTILFKFIFVILGIDADFVNVRVGKINCIFPEQFVQGKPGIVRANIHYKGGDFDLHNSENEAIYFDSIRVGEAMRIEMIEIDNLESSGFIIKSIGNAEQVIDTSDYIGGNWEWLITPTKSGNFKLGIKSSVLITTNQGAKYIDYPIIPYSVHVEARFWYEFSEFIKEYWLLILLILAFIIWFQYFRVNKSKLKNKYSAISLTEIRDFEKNLTKMIEAGDIKTALDLSESLLSRCNSSTLLNNVILLKSNFSQYKSSFNMNLIDYNEYNRNEAKTSEGLLELKDNIKSIIKVIN
ncbi:MAG TPA: hypothetical protein PLO67_07700 [Saprospiraceae bacterium]|nr:hypothetical protein [Saprospiraceae bacterium]